MNDWIDREELIAALILCGVQITLLTAKVTGVIAWSWVWVLLPLWCLPLLSVAILLAMFIRHWVTTK